MSEIENLLKEICRLRQHVDDKEHSEPELEALFKDINDAIKQLTGLRGKIFNELYSLKTKDLKNRIRKDHE